MSKPISSSGINREIGGHCEEIAKGMKAVKEEKMIIAI
jgi:hypothetical protein